MAKSQLPFLTTTELAKLIQEKQISPVEATEAYLDRIVEVDDILNS
jgi:Asp-tRNA(Asn)/Glu-tRNA(Gln) amidotransferase A subunit family amidase